MQLPRYATCHTRGHKSTSGPYSLSQFSMSPFLVTIAVIIIIIIIDKIYILEIKAIAHAWKLLRHLACEPCTNNLKNEGSVEEATLKLRTAWNHNKKTQLNIAELYHQATAVMEQCVSKYVNTFHQSCVLSHKLLLKRWTIQLGLEY